MPVFSYRTIQRPSQGLYKEKGSKFISLAYPVVSELDIKTKIDFLKKEYFDARHHGYAWMLGAAKKHFRAYDDGEPNHSAGDPILSQIRSNNITDVLIVVVRYFGGTKLGVGGLTNAYKSAAEDAMRQAIIIQKEVMASFQLDYSYDATPDVMKLVKDFDLVIDQQDFSERCSMQVSVTLRLQEALLEKLALMSAMNIALKFHMVL